ncbi:MAG: barstar family protein [Pseudomonadota bacterium]
MEEPFTLLFDGASIQSEADFHDEVRHQSGIDWYGANLDALDDTLITLIPCAYGRFRIEWRNCDKSMPRERQRYLMIVGLMKEAEAQFPDRIIEFKMTFSEPYFDEGQDSFLSEP